jgi:hypothetical protein
MQIDLRQECLTTPWPSRRSKAYHRGKGEPAMEILQIPKARKLAAAYSDGGNKPSWISFQLGNVKWPMSELHHLT